MPVRGTRKEAQNVRSDLDLGHREGSPNASPRAISGNISCRDQPSARFAYPSLKAKISRRTDKPCLFRTSHRSGRKSSASGPQTAGSCWTTFTGIAMIVPFGTRTCKLVLPGSGSDNGMVIDFAAYVSSSKSQALPWGMDPRLRHDGFQRLADGREAFPSTQHPARGIFYSDRRKMDLLPRKLLLSNLAEHED